MSTGINYKIGRLDYTMKLLFIILLFRIKSYIFNLSSTVGNARVETFCLLNFSVSSMSDFVNY